MDTMSAWSRKLWDVIARRACCCCRDCCPDVAAKVMGDSIVQPVEVNYLRRGRPSRVALGSTSSEHSLLPLPAQSNSPAPQPPTTCRSDSVFLPETDRPTVTQSGSATFAGPSSPITWRSHRQSVQPKGVGALDESGYAPPTSAPAGSACPPCLVGPPSMQRYRFSYGPDLSTDQIKKDLYHQPTRPSSSSSNTASSAMSESPPPQTFPTVCHHLPLAQTNPEDSASPNPVPVLNLHLSLLQEPQSLSVRVISAENLPPPPATPRPLASNPYVRARLLRSEPSGAAIGPSCSTAVQKRTQNPLWNEMLNFPLPPGTVGVNGKQKAPMGIILEVQVRDYDHYSRQWTIGKKEIELGNIDFTGGGQQVRVTLQPIESQVGEDLGDAYISLHYLPSAGRISCNVIKLRNIHQRDPSRRPDPYVKVVFMDEKKVLKTKKSATKRNSLTPIYNELFRCDIPEDRLTSLSLIISVYDARGTVKDELLGRIVMGKLSQNHGPLGTNEEAEQRVWQYLLSRKIAPTEPRWFKFKAKRQLFGN